MNYYKYIKYHYKIQLKANQIMEITNTILKYNGCNLLVFGLGNDSKYWIRVNTNGLTYFIEDNMYWFSKIVKDNPGINACIVDYKSLRSNWKYMLYNKNKLYLKLPQEVLDLFWDVIIIDGPRGSWWRSCPGRMKSIFMSSILVANNGYIYLHDCNRIVERVYSSVYFNNFKLFKQISNMNCYYYEQ